MNTLADSRFFIQQITLIISIITLCFLVLSVIKKTIPWRYAFMPGAIMTQLVAFYSYVVVMQPEPSATITFWSAVIRFETVAGLFIVLFGIYRTRP